MDALLGSARAPAQDAADPDPGGFPLPVSITAFLGRDTDLQTLRGWLGGALPAVPRRHHGVVEGGEEIALGTRILLVPDAKQRARAAPSGTSSPYMNPIGCDGRGLRDGPIPALSAPSTA